jgi:hypothetical protein
MKRVSPESNVRVGEALDDLERMRESEGAALAGEMRGRSRKSKLKCR